MESGIWKESSMRDEQFTLIGRQPVLEAYRSGQTVDRLFVQEGLREGTLSSGFADRAAKRAFISDRELSGRRGGRARRLTS